MSGFVRYTCNKKNIPVMRKDCEKCSEYNPCAEDGKWCFAGALVAEHDPICAECSMPLAENASAPVMRDMSTITINLGDGVKLVIPREDIKKQIERELYKGIGLMYDA